MEDQRHAAWNLGWQSLSLFVLLAGYHLTLRCLMIHRELVLGAVGPGTVVYRLVPLYAYVKPHFMTGLLLAIGAVVGYWCWLRAVGWNPQRHRRAFVPTLMLWYLVLASAVAMIDGGNYATPRQYVHLAVANLAAFFTGTGIPLAVLFFRQSFRDVLGREAPSPGRILSLSFLAALAILVAAPLYTLEVERIWLFMVPLAVVTATRTLDGPEQADRPGPLVGLTFWLLSLQAVAMEVLLNTTW